MQGQKYSRKQKTYKENHNARSSNTQTQRTIKQHARMHNAKRIYKKKIAENRKHIKKITTHDQATRKHNARSSNTHACTTHGTYTKMQNAKTKTNMHNRKQVQMSTIK